MDLKPGNFVNIPAHKKHRVEWTTPDEPTIWLAVFYSSSPCEVLDQKRGHSTVTGFCEQMAELVRTTTARRHGFEPLMNTNKR